MNAFERKSEAIARAIKAQPGITGKAIAEQLGVRTASLYQNLRDLQDLGVIRKEGKTSNVTWWPETEAAA